MKAMIFAAGLGTRLKPFTLRHPKALVPVGGQPMLGRVINRLIQAGITDITVNVHHFSSQIIDYIKANDNFDADIHISDESDLLLDTGGGILAARPLIDGDEDIIVHNADILTDVDINAFLESHRLSGAQASLLVKDRQTSRLLLFDPDSLLMRGWTNVTTGAVRPEGLSDAVGLRKLAFGGVHIISPRLLGSLAEYAARKFPYDPSPVFSITDFYIDRCSEIPVHAYIPSTPYSWIDVGKPESLEMAEKEVQKFGGFKN